MVVLFWALVVLLLGSVLVPILARTWSVATLSAPGIILLALLLLIIFGDY